MIFNENCLSADTSHEISYLIFSKIKKDVAKCVVGALRVILLLTCICVYMSIQILRASWKISY